MINFNIPTTITQGDRVTWKQILPDYNPVIDTLSCFIRGATALDLTGTPLGEGWEFEIESTQSQALAVGTYCVQFVIYEASVNRQALGTTKLVVCADFEDLTTFETRSFDEIELEAVTKAIAAVVSGGTAEYRIGDRMVRYQDLAVLTERQLYLRNRINKSKNPQSIGGRNVGVRFRN
ncbi:MAG: hypothetical protein HC764_23205 [Pleurocapsa sp. CRU_1_2]|nr:hypothetical protein [Pleurocapsa sp. CRU_1_2]